MEKGILHILRCLGFEEEKIMKHVELANGIDGFLLMNGCTVVVQGFKIIDIDSKTPISKQDNYGLDEEGKVKCNVQTPENQIAFQMCITKENKSLLQKEFVEYI